MACLGSPATAGGRAVLEPAEPPAGVRHGDPIHVRPIASPTGCEGFAITYWSTSASGDLVPVSGVLYRPAWRVPDVAPILAWAHGSYGLGSHCTNEAYFSDPACTGLVTMTTQRGGVFVATDYEGLGAAMPHPYLVGRVAARNVLDSVVAALRLGATGPAAPVLLIGWSQGGGAALLAAEDLAAYAPHVRLRGVLASAPAGELDGLVDWLDGSARFGYVLMAAYGYTATYPELAALTSERSLRELARIGRDCVGDILEAYAGGRSADHGLGAMGTHPAWLGRLRENSPGHGPTGVPTLLLHGVDDDTVPARVSRLLVERYRSLGEDPDARFYDGVGHGDITEASAGDMTRFADAILGHAPGSWLPPGATRTDGRLVVLPPAPLSVPLRPPAS